MAERELSPDEREALEQLLKAVQDDFEMFSVALSAFDETASTEEPATPSTQQPAETVVFEASAR